MRNNRTSLFFVAAILLCGTLCHGGDASAIVPDFVLAPNFIGTSIPIIRSSSSELPESISREALATIDRSRNAIVQLQEENGEWITTSGGKTFLPALALFDGSKSPSPFYSNELSRATQAATVWLTEIANTVWTLQQTREAAIVINLLYLSGGSASIPPAAVEHLKNLPDKELTRLDPVGKYFFILALANLNELPIKRFDTIIREQARLSKTELLPICMIGISRLMRANTDIPANDAKAYLRFIGNKLQLGYHNLSPSSEEPLTPQLGFLTMIFASGFPNRQFAKDKSIFPYDWRNHLANRIIASQIYCTETGEPYWRGASSTGLARSSYEALEASTLAIITLINLAN